MDAPERAARPARLILALVLATGAVACRTSAPRGAAKPSTLPPQSVSQAATPPPPAAEAPVALSAPKESVVVIDPGTAPTDTKQNIVDAARAERTRRQDAQTPIAVINDKNLGQYAAGQKLTVANPEPATASAKAKPAAPAAGDEDQWRKRGLELRKRWHDAVDRIAELQRQAAALRDRFYATDDPSVRDGEVKPTWDRVLEQIRESERVIEESRQKVADFLDEGRRAGVLPGWLREGVELEPTPAPPAAKSPEPGEPVVVQESPPA